MDPWMTDLTQQVATNLGQTAGPMAMEFAEKGRHGAYGLLPVAIALLIVHELYRSTAEGGVFRVGYVLSRMVVGSAAVLFGYSWICSFLTMTGTAGGKLDFSAVLNATTDTDAAIASWWDQVTYEEYWAGLGQLFLMTAVCAIIFLSSLFAYVAGELLRIAQAAILALLLGIGPLCLTLSIIPGVPVGKSWAMALAKTAAWTTVLGFVTKILGDQTESVKHLIVAGNIAGLLKAAGGFIVLALCTLAAPAITSALAAGAAPAAAGVAGALAMGMGLARGTVVGAVEGGIAGAKGIARAAQSGGPKPQGAMASGFGAGGVVIPRAAKLDISPRGLAAGLMRMAAWPVAAGVGAVARRLHSSATAKDDGGAGTTLGAKTKGRGTRSSNVNSSALSPQDIRTHLSAVDAYRAEQGEFPLRGDGFGRALIRPDKEGPNPDFEQMQVVDAQLAGGPLDSRAMSQQDATDLCDLDRRALWQALPVLRPSPETPWSDYAKHPISPIEARTGAVLRTYNHRFQGWTYGRQGVNDLEEAQRLASLQLNARARETAPAEAPAPHPTSAVHPVGVVARPDGGTPGSRTTETTPAAASGVSPSRPLRAGSVALSSPRPRSASPEPTGPRAGAAAGSPQGPPVSPHDAPPEQAKRGPAIVRRPPTKESGFEALPERPPRPVLKKEDT